MRTLCTAPHTILYKRMICMSGMLSREFFLVMANVFFSTQPELCCGLNLFVNTVFLVLHNVPGDVGCLKLLKVKHSVYPASSSKLINHLASLMLCSGMALGLSPFGTTNAITCFNCSPFVSLMFVGWWSTFCSIIVLSREAQIGSCTGKALDPITTPSCQLALENAASRSAENTKACPTGCKLELEPDLVPFVCLLAGVLGLVLLHLVAYLVSTSDRYVTKTLKEKTVKKWMSLHSGTASLHSAAIEKAEENAEHAARVLLARTQMRYRLFPDHATEAANNMKKMLARSAAGSFAKALESQLAYITEEDAFARAGIFRDGFSKDRCDCHHSPFAVQQSPERVRVCITVQERLACGVRMRVGRYRRLVSRTRCKVLAEKGWAAWRAH